MSAAEEAAVQRDAAAEVRALRRSINVTADAIRETYDELTDDDS
jgi:CRISPR/Cas system CSM-associated protein Csm2 small subunit